MYVVVIPLAVHYSHLLPQIDTREKAILYLDSLNSLRSSLLQLIDLLRYSRKNHIHAPEYHQQLARNIHEIENFIVEVQDIRDRFKQC